MRKKMLNNDVKFIHIPMSVQVPHAIALHIWTGIDWSFSPPFTRAHLIPSSRCRMCGVPAQTAKHLPQPRASAHTQVAANGLFSDVSGACVQAPTWARGCGSGCTLASPRGFRARPDARAAAHRHFAVEARVWSSSPPPPGLCGRLHPASPPALDVEPAAVEGIPLPPMPPLPPSSLSLSVPPHRFVPPPVPASSRGLSLRCCRHSRRLAWQSRPQRVHCPGKSSPPRTYPILLSYRLARG